MRIYLLVFGLFFLVTSPAFAADEDDAEYSEDVDENLEEDTEEDSDNGSNNNEESEDSDEEDDQDDSQPYGMIPQSGFMQQQNMMLANQPYIDQNGMIYQNGVMNQDPNGFQSNMMMPNYQDLTGFQNNVMMPNYQDPNGFQNNADSYNQQTASSETKNRIRSIVNRLLGISTKAPQTQEQKDFNAVQNTELQNKLEKLREYMGEIIQESKENINDITQTSTKSEDSFLDKEVKNLLIQLQQRMNGVIQNKIQKYQKEMIQSLNGIPLVKKTTVYKTVAPKKSAKARPAKKWSKKPVRRKNSYKKPKYIKGYYTIKQFTPENDRQYVPKPFSSNYSPASSGASQKVGGYVIKNWGTKATTVVNPTQAPTQTSAPAKNNYFSKKSDCGCSLF